MTLSIHLPQPMEQALNSYCANHAISQDQAIAQALEQFLSAQDQMPNAYELGKSGFGADETHAGDIARNSKQLLRQKFRGESASSVGRNKPVYGRFRHIGGFCRKWSPCDLIPAYLGNRLRPPI